MIVKIGNIEPVKMNEQQLQAFLFNNGFADWSTGSLPIPRKWIDPIIKIVEAVPELNSIHFEYSSVRIRDNKKICHKGTVDFNDCVLIYEQPHNQSKVKYFKLKDINYLIEQGYKVDLSSYDS